VATLRRLISFALSATLKNSFEQIFSPPIMVESIFAELGATPGEDVLVRVHYDGNHHYETSGTLLAHSDPKKEEEAAAWLRQNLKPNDSLTKVASACLTVWQNLMDDTYDFFDDTMDRVRDDDDDLEDEVDELREAIAAINAKVDRLLAQTSSPGLDVREGSAKPATKTPA